MKSKTIDSKRIEIDKLDSLLIKLLSDRFNLSKEISNLKSKDDIDNYDPKREKIIFDNLKNILIENGDDDKSSYIESVYRTLLIESKSYQSK